MKKLYYLLLLTSPLLLLPGCQKFEDNLFDESSSQRVQSQIDEAFKTLTASEQGWYLSLYQGWSTATVNSNEIGGYWFWAKFNDDYSVEVAAEFDTDRYSEETGRLLEAYSMGETCKSTFDIIMGRGAVLTFNTHNTIFHYWSQPYSSGGGADAMGLQGESEYTICEITSDRIKVQGIRSGKYMYFYKKTDGKLAADVLKGSYDFFNEMTACPAWTAEIKGAVTATEAKELIDTYKADMKNVPAGPKVTLNRRVFTLEYSENKGLVDMDFEVEPGVFETRKVPDIVNHEITILFTTSLTDKTVTLFESIEVLGNQITGFTFAYNSELGVLTSNDANNTVRIIQDFPPINELFPRFSWIADPTDGGSGPSFMAAWNAAVERNNTLNGETLVPEVWYGSMQATLGSSAVGITFLSELGSDLWGAQYNFTFKATEGTENEISLIFDGNGALDSAYYRSTFQNLIDAYVNNSPYIIEANSVTNPTVVVFKSKADPDFYFTCEKL